VAIAIACGCKERGDAILRGVTSVAKGDLNQTAAELKFIVKSATRDAAVALRQKTARIKSRLIR
jgi:hypothetical protein